MNNALLYICKDLQGMVPAEIQVIPYGSHTTPKGDFVHDQISQDLVINDFMQRRKDTVIDYEHQTLKGIEAPAAGWIKSAKIVNKGQDGTWVEVEWTEKAKQYIANKEYRYVSPVFLVRKADRRVVKLLHVALTNDPNIDGMVPLINKAEFREEHYEIQTHKEDEAMLEKLKELLGLPAEATEEQVLEAIAKLKEAAAEKPDEQPAANKAVLDALGLKEGATESEVTGTIMAMKQSHEQTDGLSQKVVSLETKLAQRDADEAVELAINDGKITPAQKDWATNYAKRDLEGFRIFVSKAPVVVRTDKVVNNEKPGEGALDETQVQVNKMLGVDDETFKKHNQAS